MADINVTADPLVSTSELRTGLLSWTPLFRDPSLDQTLDLAIYDEDDNQPFIFATTLVISGDWINKNNETDAFVTSVTLHGDWLDTILIEADPFIVTMGMQTAEVTLAALKKNWVKWSKIGYLDFTKDRTNEAGSRPLDWKGFIYHIKKLNKKVIAYGENGISILQPSGVSYGLDTIYRVGLKSKNAIAGTDRIHWFVDKIGQLWELSEGLKKLDYSEYLSAMSNTLTTLSYDELNNILYICDGTIGFAYREGSLGKGPVNVSGISYQGGTLYVASPASITSRVPEICTDIYDLGTRKGKTIHSLEVSTDLTGTLQASIHYRRDKASAFNQTSWQAVDRRGMAFISVFGHEFKFAFKVPAWEYFEIDRIGVNMSVHDH